MTQKPKFSLEQFKAKHVVPVEAEKSIIGGTLVWKIGGKTIVRISGNPESAEDN